MKRDIKLWRNCEAVYSYIKLAYLFPETFIEASCFYTWIKFVYSVKWLCEQLSCVLKHRVIRKPKILKLTSYSVVNFNAITIIETIEIYSDSNRSCYPLHLTYF